MEDKMQIILAAVMAALDLVLIMSLRKKLREERRFAEECERLSAAVISVTAHGTDYRRASCSVIVKADNGCTYRVWSSGGRALTMKAGDTVEILVPDGAAALMEENEHFEKICRRGREALETLSEEEKKRLNVYLNQRISNGAEVADSVIGGRAPVLASEGKGLKREIVPLAAIIAVMSFFVVAFGYFAITGR